MAPPNIAVDPAEIEHRRRKRTWRLAAVELPLLRLAGSVLLSLAVYVNNHFILHAVGEGWLVTTGVIAAYALVSWALIALFLRRDPPIDITLPVLFGDLPVWTFAIYQSGAEESWLFFILLLRVADQVQTTFRRAVAFALFGAACYATMLAWVVLVDGRAVATSASLAKLIFILFAGIYISLAARTAETRRARLTESIRVSRDLIRRLEEAHARAEEASAAKSEFVANMSHEMRTPLQGVIGMLQLAIEDETSEESVRRLESARRSAETLMAMIDDVLDFSRIEARKLELEPVYFSLRQFLAETMKSVGVIAAAKRLTLSYIVQPDVADNVWGDSLRLRQILVNLVGNAIKFTHEGEIAVLVSRSTNTSAGHRVRFDVRDTGVGIAPALRQRIFEPFTQADSSYARNYGGAGLGLSIVVRLLEAMGGTVDVASEQGAGSVFSFDIPLASDSVDSASQRQPWESALAGKSILIVEPAATARSIIKEILRGRGVFASAFARASEAPAGRFACAVTADPSVPVQPQVLITSPLQQTEHALHVTRPVGERELIDAIGIALGLAARPPEYTLEPAFRAPSALRVLLVDDSDVNREVLSEMLRRLGHEASVAADGESALAMLATTTFDIVFMDVQLPNIDGLEVTRRFRAAGGKTPVIALTAHTSREDRDRCLAAGMNAVVTKPVDAARLGAAIEAATRRESIVDVVGGNVALLARVRDAFARQTPELLSGMRDALARLDADALARHAHKLKGSLSYFPGDRGAGIAREIELAAKSNELGRAASLLPELEQAVAELSEALARTAG
ncbi:MAG TPA: ATP-binding protein [Thermoanaerobaculia bacterium]|nr:ATP-binding protein [Thermoanaerobaculia bacterium]